MCLVNAQVEKLFGYAARNCWERKLRNWCRSVCAASIRRPSENFLAEPRVRPMGAGLELYGLHKDGSEFPVEISLSPLETEEGVLVSSAIRDISERKRLGENNP